MSVQNIIFDWDGTLARTLELWLVGYQTSLNRRDLKFEPKEIVAEFFTIITKFQTDTRTLTFQK